ncbi:MAG: aconitate hydratase [Clostridia bacterium BRH_c25]|nr:MAG: aconitate hydratase [Clostridia bacterium BRH_c25]
MGMTLTEKLITSHLVRGTMKRGERIGIKIDQTLTHDVNGVMAYLEFEALGIKKVKGDLAVSYIDHNMLQADFRNPDDHRFLIDMAKKLGSICSRPGNGICHQLHVERFAIPGKTLLGSDSHTTASGGVGMLAMGAGGLDVAMAMAGEPFYFNMPRIIKVVLSGRLQPFVSVKNVNLELLRRLTVKGGLNAVLEYDGPAIKDLNVTERATLCNMGTETGATTSVFPSDEMTKFWLQAQSRGQAWTPLHADFDAVYDDIIEIDLSGLEPLIALPHQPDNVVPVREAAGIGIDQIMFGGCTNSSLQDVLSIAHMMDGSRVHNNVDAGLYCGSQQVMLECVQRGTLEKLIRSGVRILEMFCGACNGMGFAPPTNGISLRTGPRNFIGRCGHPTGHVYLVSPETAAASAVHGRITDPRDLRRPVRTYAMPDKFIIDDSRFIYPEAAITEDRPIRRGPNICPLPEIEPIYDELRGEVLLNVGDDITTDHIVPAGANFLPMRNNTPEIAKHVFKVLDETFAERARAAGNGFVIAGFNYGQGSSREQAALAPRYLGVRAIIAKSFARIHMANLVNFGILPLILNDFESKLQFEQGDFLRIDTVVLREGEDYIVHNLSKGIEAAVKSPLSQDELDIIKVGGRLNWIKLHS